MFIDQYASFQPDGSQRSFPVNVVQGTPSSLLHYGARASHYTQPIYDTGAYDNVQLYYNIQPYGHNQIYYGTRPDNNHPAHFNRPFDYPTQYSDYIHSSNHVQASRGIPSSYHLYGNDRFEYLAHRPDVNSNDQTYPEVDPTQLSLSAQAFRRLVNEASMILDQLEDSPEFNEQIMTAAQKGDTEEVKRLLASTGITSDFDVRYNPDGMDIELSSKVGSTICCRLTMSLRWR